VSEDRVGKYRLLNLLATGGMGEVYLARQEGPAGFSKPAVVKRILPHLSKDPAFVELFLNEARLAALLTHPNCVHIFELGEADGTYFIAMEHVHGRTLRSIQQRLKAQGRPFPPVQAARICAQALHGLHSAHTLKGDDGKSLGIVHRDVSPDNVMVGFNGEVKVLDFGIAEAGRVRGEPAGGNAKGKFAYVSPEQLNAEHLDGRADQWSVGVVLYELLAGRRPYTAPVDGALINLILTSEPAPLTQAAPDAPAPLVAIVERAMKKSRAERFDNAEEMALALESYAASQNAALTNGETQAFMRELFGEEALAPLPGLRTGRFPPAEPLPPRLRPVTLIAAGATALALGAGVFWWRFRPVETPTPQRPEPVAVAVVDAGVAVAVEPPPLVVDAGAAVVTAPVEAATPDAAAPHVAKAPAKATGRLDLRVNPWAQVFEGRKSLGVTPMAPFELAVGTHHLTLKNPDLKVSRDVTVKVTKGSTVVQRVDLMR
jgi:serine/threonine-protein kinase